MKSSVFKKSFVLIFLLVSFLSFAAPGNFSQYRNNEDHRTYKLDENNIPIDHKCRFKTLWRNVRLSAVTKADIPNRVLGKITIVKFHWAGAWIAWTDKDGYHEPTKDDYIPWRNFPNEISDYYAQYCMPHWKREVRASYPFTLRTPQYGKNGRLIQRKYGTLIKRRGITGLLCPEISNNVYVPFSEFPPLVRELVGFWENESYIEDMPLLEKTPPSLNDDILLISAREFRIVRRFLDGVRAQVIFHDGQKTVTKDIFITKVKGRIRPNHKSDLHIMENNKFHKICNKCDLSDHTSGKYFNYMYDRQIRSACPVKHEEYAFKKIGTKKIGRIIMPKYEYVRDFDKNNDPDSVRLQKEAANSGI